MASGGLVMLAGGSEHATIVCNALAVRFGVTKVILEQSPGRTGHCRRRWHYLRRRARALGLRTVLGQLPFQVAVAPAVRYASRSRLDQIMEEHGLDSTPIGESKIVRVRSVNDEEARRQLEALRPEVVAVKGTSIISGGTLRCVSAPFVNMHGGITPLYRGIHCAYWALYNGDPHACGVTVHLVDEGIDTGRILRQRRIEPTESDNFITYPLLQVAVGIPLMASAIEDLLEGRLETQPPPAGRSALWSHPTLREYLVGRLLYGVK